MDQTSTHDTRGRWDGRGKNRQEPAVNCPDEYAVKRLKMDNAKEHQPSDSKPVSPARPGRRPWAWALLGVSTVVGIGVGGFYYVSLFSYENTDDAFVEGHMVVPVGPRAARRMAKVHVTEPQWGNQGELVAEIARRGFEARLAAARAGPKFPSLAMDVAGITSTDPVQEASSAVEDAKPLAPGPLSHPRRGRRHGARWPWSW